MDSCYALLELLEAPDGPGRKVNAVLDTMIWSDDINGLKQNLRLS